MMTMIVAVFQGTGLMVSDKGKKKSETRNFRAPRQEPQQELVAVEAAGQKLIHTNQFPYVSGICQGKHRRQSEIEKGIRFARTCFDKVWSTAVQPADFATAAPSPDVKG